MGIEGHDYEELIDKWGLRKKYKKLDKAIGSLCKLALITDDEAMDMQEEIGIRLLTVYIGNAVTHDNDGNTFIDEYVHVDMLNFLDNLRNHSVCTPGDSEMYKVIKDMGIHKDTIFEFYRWFVHCLPLMWN